MRFGTGTHHSHGLLENVHVNVWGPTKTASLGGHRYFVSFVDNLSRRYWIYPMRQKFKVLHMLVKCKNIMEKQADKKIKVLQIDNVGEYKDQFL